MTPRKFSLIAVLSFVLSGLFFVFGARAESQNFSSKKSKVSEAIHLEKPMEHPRVGEKLVFAVSWMGIPVGFGSLEVKEKVLIHGREAYHVIALAGTNDFLSSLYPLRDEIHSFFDAEDFRSLEFRKTLKEGRYRADEKIVFDHAVQKGTYESFVNKGKKEIEISEGAKDIVSAFYWFRSQSVAVGDKVSTLINSEEKDWQAEFRVLKAETKTFRNRGTVPTILVEPDTRLKGILYDRGRAWVNFSADKKRTPVWITLKTPFGPVVGVLESPKKWDESGG